MWNNILLFTGTFLFKNILLDLFFNYSQIFLFPLELASLSIFNKEYIWTNFINWIFVGFIGFNNEIKLLTYMDSYNSSDSYMFFIIWLFTFLILQIYYLIKHFVKRSDTSLLLHMKKSNLKFILINFLPLYLWNLNELMNPSSFALLTILNFINKFIHLILSCFIIFIVPSIIFYILYGDNFFINRKKYNFLIKSFHPENKQYYLSLLLLKIILGTFVTFHYYFQYGNNYSIIVVNLINILYNLIVGQCNNKIYLDNNDNYSNYIFLAMSLLISITSQINIYITNLNISFGLEIFELSLFFIMILGIIINFIKYQKKKLKTKNYKREVELTRNQLVE